MTTIGELGEDALIAAFAPRLPTTDAELLGPGDDAAVLSVDGDLVVSSDVLVEGRHFRLDWSTGEDIGWRAAVQNLADIDAMGAVPTALQVTLAAPATRRSAGCSPSPTACGWPASPTALAWSAATSAARARSTSASRRSAKPTALTPLPGPTLRPATSWPCQPRLVRRRPAWPCSRRASPTARRCELFKRPRPFIGAGLEAALQGATAMMDISDGLLRDATRIARASDVAIDIDLAAVPVHLAAVAAGRTLNRDAAQWALTGGEDHHMLAAFPAAGAVPVGWTVIGRVNVGAGVTVDGAAPTALGWDHFGG